MDDVQANPLSVQRNVILGLLLALAAGAWAVLLWQSADPDMDMTMASSTMGLRAPLFLAIWVTMMVAMMFPTAVPMILTFHKVQTGKRERGDAFVSTWVFVAAYILVWTLAGVFPEFSAKCLELLIESVPMLAGVGVLWDPSTGSLQLKAVEAAAQQFRIRMQVFEARRAGDIAETFYSLDRSRIQGILLLSSPLFAGNPQMVTDLAMRRSLPTISLFHEIAREGGLLAYGPDVQHLFRQVGAMTRKVLQGAKVAELPAERPTRFQLVANLKTAKLFGITLPPSILLRADEVIE